MKLIISIKNAEDETNIENKYKKSDDISTRFKRQYYFNSAQKYNENVKI